MFPVTYITDQDEGLKMGKYPLAWKVISTKIEDIGMMYVAYFKHIAELKGSLL